MKNTYIYTGTVEQLLNFLVEAIEKWDLFWSSNNSLHCPKFINCFIALDDLIMYSNFPDNIYPKARKEFLDLVKKHRLKKLEVS